MNRTVTTDQIATAPLVLTDKAQAQLDDHFATLAAASLTPDDGKVTLSAAQVAADAAMFGDIIEPVSKVAPVGVPRSRRLARKQAQGEVRAAVKHFRKSRLDRARADVAGLPDALRDRSYAPDDLRAARAVLPPEAGLLDVLTEAARIADERPRLVVLDEVAEVTAPYAATDLADLRITGMGSPA